MARKRRKGGHNKHKNKYEHLAPEKKLYDEKDKSRRCFPVSGEVGSVIPKGSIIPFHGRMYRTEADVTIVVSLIEGVKPHAYVWCRLQRMLPGEVL